MYGWGENVLKWVLRSYDQLNWIGLLLFSMVDLISCTVTCMDRPVCCKWSLYKKTSKGISHVIWRRFLDQKQNFILFYFISFHFFNFYFIFCLRGIAILKVLKYLRGWGWDLPIYLVFFVWKQEYIIKRDNHFIITNPSLALKMQVILSSETLVNAYKFLWRCNPGNPTDNFTAVRISKITTSTVCSLTTCFIFD
jgi:hypothetical protein